MEKKSFYNRINEFLIKNVVLLVIFLFLILITIHQNKLDFRTRASGYNNVRNIAGRSYSKAVMADSASFEMAEDGVATMNAVQMKTSAINQQNTQSNRKIVKNFNLSIVVKDVAKAKNSVENELEKYKGYASNFYSYEYSNRKAINMELKIPSEKVDDYLNFVKKIGYIKSESFSSVDYTEQYNDNENKLKNLYARRDKLRDMMKMQAKQLTDLLAVDRELNNTQIEIERLEKRNTKIQKDVDFSNVSLTIEPEIVENRENLHWSIKKVFINAIDLLILFCHAVVEYVVVAMVFLPIILAAFVVIFASKKIYNYVKNRKN